MSFHRYAVLLGTVCAACPVVAPAYAQPASPADELTLAQALSRAVADAPVARVTAASMIAADAAVRQADRGLNPTIDFQLENALGTGFYSGISRTEGTLSFSQTIERGGDRRARTELAERQGDRLKIDGDIALQDLQMEVETAYVDAQRAVSERVVAEERLAIAREISSTVDRRVQAARDPLLAASRSLTLVAEAEIAVENARRSEQAAKERLASFWGGVASFDVETVSFLQTSTPGRLSADNTPEMQAARAAEREAEARIAVERAKSKLDPTVSAGVRYFNDRNEAAFVVGFSIPLGINDNNSAAVDRASAESQRAHLQTDVLRRNTERLIASARSQMDIAANEVASLDARLVPTAQQAVERAQQGYAQGGFSYLDVLDAQRVLSNARLQRISALSSYHRARTALKRLLGEYADASK